MEEAKLPHNPLPPLKATIHNPEPHLPGAVEHELGTGLQSEVDHGHPGLTCDQLPASHAHPLPKFDSKHKHHTNEQDPETPPASPLAPLDEEK